jgi:hypothetical protein
MVRFLIRAAIWLASAAIGLLIANAVLDDMILSASSFVTAVLIFATVQSIIGPFLAKVTARNASALLGAVGLLSTIVALVVTAAVSDGLSISGFGTWVLASLIVWLATMLATLVLPMIFLRKAVGDRR